MRKLVLLALALAAMIAPQLLSAREYTISAAIAGPPSGEFTFTLPYDFTPNFYDPGSSFTVANVTYIQGGQAPCYPCEGGSFTFFTDQNGNLGGLQTTDGGYYAGAVLFSGTVDHPTLIPGTYDITYIDDNSFYNGTSGDVSISLSAPEPAMWSLLIIGFGGVGLVMRVRGRRIAAPA